MNDVNPRKMVERAMAELSYDATSDVDEVKVRDFIKRFYSSSISISAIQNIVAQIRNPLPMADAACVDGNGKVSYHGKRVAKDLAKINEECPGQWNVIEMEVVSEALLAFGGDVDELLKCAHAVRRLRTNWGAS